MNKPCPYILLIDDDDDDLQMLSSGLEKEGIRVKFFNSPAKALFYLQLMSDSKELPVFIIMDYNMPRKNGYEVLLLLKENSETKLIPVLIYSTSMPDFLRTQLSNAGAFNCFIKAASLAEFGGQVEVFRQLAYSFTENKI